MINIIGSGGLVSTSGARKALLCGTAALALLCSAAAAAQREPASAAADCRPAAAGGAIRIGQCVRSALGPEDPVADGASYEEWRIALQAGQRIEIELDALDPPRPAGSTPADNADGPWPFDAYLELRRAGVEAPVAENDDRGGSLNSRIEYPVEQSGDYMIRARPLGQGSGPYTLRVGIAVPPPVPTPLSGAGATVTIRPDSPRSPHSGELRYGAVSFAGAAGERVQISGRGTGNGAAGPLMLHLVDEVGTVIANGGGADAPEATLVAALPAAGTYTLQVAAPATVPTNVAVQVRRRPAPTGAPVPRRIAAGGEATGALGIDSHALPVAPGESFGSAIHDLYALDAVAGETLTVSLESDDFDALLEAGGNSVLGFAIAASDDDGGRGLNSRLVLRPQGSGTVLLRVRALDGRFGRYRLSVARGETEAPADEE
ncbi:MAG TPA: hypothetical protein VF552_09655 [Allosphingosinicella sp.]|jgi:hypothetical protein